MTVVLEIVKDRGSHFALFWHLALESVEHPTSELQPLEGIFKEA